MRVEVQPIWLKAISAKSKETVYINLNHIDCIGETDRGLTFAGNGFYVDTVSTADDFEKIITYEDLT